MSALLELLVSNSIVVLPIAILATLLSRTGARPAWVHALWLIVLIKLITPPLVRVPVAVEWGDPTSWVNSTEAEFGPSERALTLKVVEEGRPASIVPAPQGEPEMGEATEEDLGIALVGSRVVLAERAFPIEEAVNRPPSLRGEPSPSSSLPSGTGVDQVELPADVWEEMHSLLISLESSPKLGRWLGGAMLLWIVGAGVVAFASLRKIRRFSRHVATLPLADASLCGEVTALCARLSLPSVPTVRTTRAVLSPMVWAPALRPVLILPETLLERLSADERQTLILHELAHVRRRDHWVRYLELVVRIVHFANPLAWWAIHELRAAEEECCDVWVTTVFCDSERPYSAALLAAAEFLTTSRRRLPTTSTGFGAVPEMRRRLTMIFHRQTQRTLGLAGRTAVILTALFTLPLLPGWAQDAPGLPPVPADVSAREAPSLDDLFDTPRGDVSARAPAPSGGRAPGDAVDPRFEVPTPPPAPVAPGAPRAGDPRGPRSPGLATAPSTGDAPRPAEVARALDLAVRLLLESGHVEEGQTLMRMAEEMVNPPRRVPGASVRASRPARVVSPRAESPRFRNSRAVVVKEGDSLYSLAEEHLGSSRRWTALARANDLAEGEGLRVGQFLRIPEQDRPAEAGNMRIRNEVRKEYPVARGGGDLGERAVEKRVEQLEKRLGELQSTLEQLLEQLQRDPERASRRSGR